MNSGPLHGLRVIELAGLAPAPFGCMLLADLGADVVRIDRTHAPAIAGPGGPLDRNRRTIPLDLKSPEGVAAVRDLARHADVFVEGYRPGVAERLGIGPDVLRELNPRLVYARLTGWGQDGPLASRAGHDINYVALAGALEPIGRAGEAPHPALNVIADFAGGGTMMAFGVLAALYERERSGLGQVIDAAMVDGASTHMTILHALRAAGMWPGERGTNLLDGGASFYEVYETKDGGHLAVGAIEPQFYVELVTRLGLEPRQPHLHPDGWAEESERFRAVFLTRTRDEWTEVFADADACVTPVLSPWEAPSHPHHVARGSFVEVDGVAQPAPAPRFDRTPAATPVPLAATSFDDVLRAWS